MKREWLDLKTVLELKPIEILQDFIRGINFFNRKKLTLLLRACDKEDARKVKSLIVKGDDAAKKTANENAAKINKSVSNRKLRLEKKKMPLR